MLSLLLFYACLLGACFAISAIIPTCCYVRDLLAAKKMAPVIEYRFSEDLVNCDLDQVLVGGAFVGVRRAFDAREFEQRRNSELAMPLP